MTTGTSVRQRSEVWTWRLVAMLASATPVARVVEMHAGGGQYDTIQVHLGDQPGEERGLVYVDCNRPGRVHVFGPGDDDWQTSDLLNSLDHGLPLADALAWILDKTDVSAAGTPSPMLAALEAMADALAVGVATGDGRTWEWRNGCLDASDGSGRREALFAAIPAAAQACVPARGDLLGIPEYRFWFLLADGDPRLAIEPATGRMFDSRSTLSVDVLDAQQIWRHAVSVTSSAGPSTPSADTPTAQAAAANDTFHPIAHRLANQVASGLVHFKPHKRLTSRAVWFTDADDNLLVLVVGSHVSRDAADEALAYALAWQCDRDLVLVLPETHVGMTLERLPWIGTPVRVFTYDRDLLVTPAIAPARSDVLQAAEARPLFSTSIHDLQEPAGWVSELIEGANNHWARLVEQTLAN